MKLEEFENYGAPTKKSGGMSLEEFEKFGAPGASEEQKAHEPLTRVEKFSRGARDPLDAAAQLLSNMAPEEARNILNRFNNWLADKTGLVGRLPESGINEQIAKTENEYQSRRKASGESGLDAYRLAGNVAATIPLAMAAPTTTALGRNIAIGAGVGGVAGGLQPVTHGEFWPEKAKQIGTGIVTGSLAPVVLHGAARIMSPKASTNIQLDKLRSEGIQPTFGQALGGRSEIFEEKLQSIPIFGDMISRAREQTLSTFNNAAINRAVAPIGKKIEGTGTAAVREAGDILSAYYDDALSKLKGVKFDARFDADLMQLKHMTRNLVPQMRRKFDTTLDDIVEHRLSPNRSMIADTFSKVESELKSKASDYLGSSTASERELGAALKQLQNILHEQMIRTNPHIAQKIRAADAGWANLVRIEKAAEAAKNKEGVFTPAQLNSSIRSADSSVRHRATARGTALMQDLGSAGQTIIGSKYPDSGTPGRIAAGLGLLGAGAGTAAFSPATALGVGSIVGTGSLMYTRPVQNMLVRAVANRPSGSNSMANLIRELSPYGAAAFAPMALE